MVVDGGWRHLAVDNLGVVNIPVYVHVIYSNSETKTLAALKSILSNGCF
jgi:hypothetical protein